MRFIVIHNGRTLKYLKMEKIPWVIHGIDLSQGFLVLYMGLILSKLYHVLYMGLI